MSSDSSCGDQYNFGERIHPDAYREQAMDAAEVEIDRLNHEIMKMKVYAQGIEIDALHEKYFRDVNPAVKDAYEQYQTVLRLAQDE